MIVLIIISILLIVVAVTIAAFYVYYVAFYSRKKGQDNIYAIPVGEQYEPHKERMLSLIDALVKREYEDVYIKSYDGLTLHGRYYHYKDGAPLNIGFHGYRATALRDFCVGANESLNRGHNLILIDQRGQGKSTGHTITMGVKEHRDVLSWVEYACERFSKDVKIVIYGVSMGASSVVMATSLDLPPNVKGIIADCPYNSPKDIILNVAKEDMKISPKLAYPFVWLAAKVFGKFDINSITCADAVKKSKIPVMIIHGEDDRYVPCEMSKVIADANPSFVTRYTFPTAGHGLSFLCDTQRYRELTEPFYKKCCED